MTRLLQAAGLPNIEDNNMFLVPVAVATPAGGAPFAIHDRAQADATKDTASKKTGLRAIAPGDGGVARGRTMRFFLIVAALAPALSYTQASASEKVKGKLGKAGVEVSVAARGSGSQVIVRRNGREFAKYTSPQGAESVLLCCTYNQCEPIGPTSFLVCDIVINCPDYHGGCFPQ